jgi:O-acetyl-ADP-ribose deacetylase
MGQDLETSAPIIERATRSALGFADSHGVASIAFPAFGTGVGGFPLDECARIMIAVVRAHEPKSLRLVRFVLFGRPAYDTFVRELERQASAERPPLA